MHKIELYGYGESVASNIARVALSEKNISYEYNLLYLESKGDHLSKKYKKLNPKNLVPTMIDNGNVIPDSIQIMRHINSTYADGTDLFPENINQDIFNNLLDFVKLDEEHQNCWLYIGVFPNLVFGLYPDSVIFYQEFPIEYVKLLRTMSQKVPRNGVRIEWLKYFNVQQQAIDSLLTMYEHMKQNTYRSELRKILQDLPKANSTQLIIEKLKLKFLKGRSLLELSHL